MTSPTSQSWNVSSPIHHTVPGLLHRLSGGLPNNSEEPIMQSYTPRRSRRRRPSTRMGELLSLPENPRKKTIARKSLCKARAGLKKLVTSDCNKQQQSLLFRALSPEIRKILFDFTLQPVFHEQREEHYMGRKYEQYYTIDTALLRTCRLIYLEAEFIPIHNDVHNFYLSRYFYVVPDDYVHLVPMHIEDRPDYAEVVPQYGEGKTKINTVGIETSSLVLHNKMLAKTKAEVQKVSIYGVSRHGLLNGHGFWGLNLRPRRVFLACVIRENLCLFPNRKFGWHDELKELTLRIDAHPYDRKKLEMEPAPHQFITKVGGDVLALVENAHTMGSWKGDNKAGKEVEWNSLTFLRKESENNCLKAALSAGTGSPYHTLLHAKLG